jgi:uncharacterized Zn finger protein
MFKCEKCGNVSQGMIQIRIPTVIRTVNYILQVKVEPRGYNIDPNKEPTFKTVGEKQGSEIVKEGIYCKLCAPADQVPRVLKEVKERKVVVKRKSKSKFRKNKKDEDNDYGRTRQDNR